MKKSRYLLLLLLPLLVLMGSRAFAQEDESWSEPLNLSRSGSATDPHTVVDSWGRTHIVWQDKFAGLVYTQGSEGSWSAPVALPLPFADYLATLVLTPDTQGLVHAAWLDESDILYYSRVAGNRFESPASWSAPLVIAVETGDFTMNAATDGRLHMAFLRNTSTPDFPAGVYVRFNYGSSDVWSLPRLVYASPYLRGLEANQAQLSLAAGPENRLYLAWDETPQEKISLATSSDGGNIWTDPVEMDQRQPGDGGSSGPSSPVVLATASGALLTWQAGHQGSNCSHYYRQSSDGGAAWSDLELLPAPFDQSCAQRVQILQNPEGETWLALTNPTGLYLLAYHTPDESSSPWSAPSLQQELNGFINPETYRAVSLACRDVNLSGELLLVSACENRIVSENRSDGNGDIWLLTRRLGETAAWFPTPTPVPPWSPSEVLAAGSSAFDQPALASDPSGRLHAFWTRSEEGSIFYALWDGERWSAEISLFNSPGGEPQDLSALLHPSGQLYLAWSDPEAGELYLSQASSSQALAPAAWNAPLPVATAGMTGAMSTAFIDPQLALAGDGTLMLAYAVPFNEGRGIYIQRSLPPTDSEVNLGSNWSQAELVFDATAAGWASLSEPRLAILPDGRLEIIWTRRDLPPGMQALGLFRAQSPGQAAAGSPKVTGGWTGAEEVLRGETLWSQFLVDANGRLQRAWQQVMAGQPVLLHQVSSDGGSMWSEAVRITGLENTEGPVAITAGTDGSLYLVQFEPKAASVDPEVAAWELNLWRWEGTGSWQGLESQPVTGLNQPETIALGLTGDGKLMTLFAGSAILQPPQGVENAADEGNTAHALSYMARRSALPANQANPIPSEQAEGSQEGDPATSVTPVVETPQPDTSDTSGVISPTATIVLASQPPGLVQQVFSSSYSTLAIGLLPAVLLVLVLFIVAAQRRK